MSRLVAKIESEEPTLRLAVLIDADNAQAAIIKRLLEEIAKFGEATVKRIYGDFTTTASNSWKKVLQEYAIKPMQQYAYTSGKNATDSALIIDAMDLLHTKKFDGFCLVTSDSDFTGLATRLREEGLYVLGFGEEKTPKAFRSACHKFILTEVLRPDEVKSEAKNDLNQPEIQPAKDYLDGARIVLLNAYEQSVQDDDGWVHLGTLGSYLSKIEPDFDSRVYGHKKLSDLIKALPDIFEVKNRPTSDGANTNYYINAK